MRKIEKTALIGMGAVGAFVAPKLTKELGENFFVIADGNRARKLEKGILINGEQYRPKTVSPESAERVDLLIFAVKNTHLGRAIEDAAPFCGEGTVVISILNGIDSEEKIKDAIPHANVLKAVIRVPAINKDGVINMPEKSGYISLGKSETGKQEEQLACVAELFDRAGIKYKIPEDMERDMWLKFMCNVSENLPCALLGLSYGAFKKDENLEKMRVKICEEVLNVAKCAGVDLRDEDIKTAGEKVKLLPESGKPSTLQDIEAGRKTEVDSFAGKVTELGEKYGVQTPYCEFLLHSIKILENKCQNGSER